MIFNIKAYVCQNKEDVLLKYNETKMKLSFYYRVNILPE